ncbi:MAG: IclR family transcriptional regulator [Chromatiales bacterium]|nr:IclR family transcriptional regulator [Chromatiales bacterium]
MSDIQVIDRAALLLDTIARYEKPMNLKILAADTGLPPSTAFRILRALASIGFVERDPQGRYLMGRKIARLAERVGRENDIRKEALPIMEALRNEVDESINLTIRTADEVVYIERVTSRRIIRVEQVIGSHAPLHVTAVGKLMLGKLGENFIQAYAKRTGLKAYTKHTLKLKQLLSETKNDIAQGFSYDNEEAEDGVGCIGTLIYDANGQVAGGLSISAPIERRKDEWVAMLIQAGKDVSERLGYRTVP